MNVLYRRILTLSLAALFFPTFGWTALPADSTADTDVTKEALARAQSWLAEIDSGLYDQSYTEGCLAFHNKVTRDQWSTVLKALRAPLGSLVSRKTASYSYKPDGYEGLDGECMVITYNTAFSKLPSDLEIVVLKREDGQWRGAGYNAQPQGEADSDSPPPANAETEVSQQPAK